MTLIDGKKIAQNISLNVAEGVGLFVQPPRMMVIACNPNFETQKYLALKKQKAETLGINLTVLILPEKTDTKTVLSAVHDAVEISDGIVIQLPLPSHIDTTAVLAALPVTHDVDAFGYQNGKTTLLPPVVGAIDEITKEYNLDWEGKKVVIFGSGRLVGAPALIYAKGKHALVEVVTKETKNIEEITRPADIIVLGVGKPNLLLPDMVKQGVVVFDAGASEDGGLLVGDASPAVAEKAVVFTPVPGGIGPITIALLFRNLLELRARQ